MRLPIVLAIVLVAASAGCTAFKRGSDEPVTPASVPTTHATTSPTPTPSTAPPTASTPPPATTTSPTPTPPTNGTQGPAPKPPQDLHASKSGWANFTADVPPEVPPSSDFVVKLPFKVERGVKSLDAQATVQLESPGGASPVQTSSFNVTILGPDGKTLASRDVEADAFSDPAANLTVEPANLTQAGEYVLQLTIHNGIGDGSSAGYKYDASVDVKYG